MAADEEKVKEMVQDKSNGVVNDFTSKSQEDTKEMTDLADQAKEAAADEAEDTAEAEVDSESESEEDK